MIIVYRIYIASFISITNPENPCPDKGFRLRYSPANPAILRFSPLPLTVSFSYEMYYQNGIRLL